MTEPLLTKVLCNTKHNAAVQYPTPLEMRGLCALSALSCWGWKTFRHLVCSVQLVLVLALMNSSSTASTSLAILRVQNVTWRGPKAPWCEENGRVSYTKESCWSFLCPLLLQCRRRKKESHRPQSWWCSPQQETCTSIPKVEHSKLVLPKTEVQH